MNIKSKLHRLKTHMGLPEIKQSSANHEKPVEEQDASFPLPHEEKWRAFGVRPYVDGDQYCFVREVSYPLSHRHGNYYLSQIKEAFTLWEQSDLSHPLSTKGTNSHQITFFDTETTGLSTGASSLIFLLGHAELLEDEVKITQHFLPSPGHEVALYKSFLGACDVNLWMSFNGKSFDWPRVKHRHHALATLLPKLPEFAHFDLFHAAKRLWKYDMKSLKLGELERERLGFVRKDDIPGHLAPFIYYDFVKHREPEELHKVMIHNELDIISLLTLFTHLTFRLLGTEERSRVEQEQIGKWFATAGETEHALSLYNGANASPIALYEKGMLLKKVGNFEEALQSFLQSIERSHDTVSFHAIIEACKIYEHKQKEYGKALHLLRLMEPFVDIEKESLRKDCYKRKKRLQKKMAKFSP